MNSNTIDTFDSDILRSRLKERRLFLDLTYQDLANKTGISKSSLQRYENGKIKNLSFDKIFKISEALAISPEYFTNLSSDYTGASFSHIIPSSNLSRRTEYFHNIQFYENNALHILTPHLISTGYSLAKESRGMIGDLVARKSNEIWHIDFFYTHSTQSDRTANRNLKQQFISRLGRLAIYNKPITKYSIVVKSDIIAEQLLAFPPTHLDITMSILVLSKDSFKELFLNN